ncbi:MAG TPA: multiheme c-type cytochrome [Longimicrobiales bacterium]|nr:multiheme c-type cytochrome [Longimicrobiales bacterium]
MKPRNDVRNALAAEWRSRLLLTVGGLLVFETLTGLSIWLLPFSVPNQVMVLLHTAVGLAFLLPFAVYQLRHWLRYRRLPVSHMVLTGYFSMIATLAAVVSGLVLTWQALFGTRISYAWDVAHIVATVALVASMIPHFAVPVVRARRARAGTAAEPVLTGQKGFALGAGAWAAVLFVLVGVAAWAYPPDAREEAFPADYGYLYGPDRPFAPSLATTSTGGAFSASGLAGSMSCGTAGCHTAIVEEWAVSAHRYSAMDPGFQKVQAVMAEQNGAESTRYCGGCHDPISLFSGTKNVFTEDLTSLAGYQEGVSCIVCHAIKETDIKGNAAYVISLPERYMFELREGTGARFVRDFLIRAYPRHHVSSLQHTLFKSPEFCAACHKQFIDEEINQVGWVQLQNQYDNWRKSRWNDPGDPTVTIECRECHMPLQESADPASGDELDYNRSPGDRKHRSHRFLGANQVIPSLLDLPGAEAHERLTEQWLRGEIEIPEIAGKWKGGPAVPVELVAPEAVRPDEEVRIAVTVTNNKVGHDFPTGPLDIIQAWLRVTVRDETGTVVYRSGHLDAANFIQPGSFIFKAEPVDQYGNLIDRHNLWEMVGVRYRRTVFPGFSDRAEFSFRSPPASARELHVAVQLLYRKFDQFLLNFLFGEDTGLTSRVTVVAEDEATIRVLPGDQD